MNAHGRRQTILAAASLLLLGGAAWMAFELTPGRPAAPGIAILALSSSGRRLASGTADGRIRIRDVERPQTGREFQETSGALNDLRFDPQERYLAIANRNITMVPLWGAAPARVIRGDQANYGTVRFTSDGQSILTITGRGAIVAVDIDTGKVHAKACCSTIYGEVALSPDDALIFAAGHWPGVWDFRSGGLIGRLTAAREFLTFGPIAMDAAGGLLFMGSQDGRVHAWNLATRQFLRASPPLRGYVSTISVLGSTGWIAYAARGGAVRLWKPATGESRVVEAARTTSNLVFDAVRNRAGLGTVSGRVEWWDLLQSKLVGEV